MFTGIVAALGNVRSVVATPTGRRIEIEAPELLGGMVVGDSVAVNGVCLTAVDVGNGSVAVDVVQESLNRSNLGELIPGSRVDLERPMPAAGRFDGHIVQGHVDGVGTIDSIGAEGDARRIRVALPEELSRYVVEKGSITVDGVSLTVTAVGNEPWFEIVLIPHTLEVTVLGLRRIGDRVNLEVDVLAKYVERLMVK
ncbi:MAG: riboflavin synthase [Acidimicrobiia bacterium]|nr:riboflavin synthase [Acidimicrobiia bacterium]